MWDSGYLKKRYKKTVTHVELHANIVSLLVGEEERHIKAINNNTKHCVTTGFLLPSTSFLLYILFNTKHSDMVMKMNIKECPGHFSFVLTITVLYYIVYISSEMISLCAASVFKH